jgi:hypothetical protein
MPHDFPHRHICASRTSRYDDEEARTEEGYEQKDQERVRERKTQHQPSRTRVQQPAQQKTHQADQNSDRLHPRWRSQQASPASRGKGTRGRIPPFKITRNKSGALQTTLLRSGGEDTGTESLKKDPHASKLVKRLYRAPALSKNHKWRVSDEVGILASTMYVAWNETYLKPERGKSHQRLSTKLGKWRERD